MLAGIAEGLNDAEIAATLKPLGKTVFDRIRVEHRYQAIALAREAGLGTAMSFVKQG